MKVIHGRDEHAKVDQRTDTFTGSVWGDPVLPKTDGVLINSVHFGPCSRTYWHRHEGGQILEVTSGEGWVGVRGARAAAHPQGRHGVDPAGRGSLARLGRRELPRARGDLDRRHGVARGGRRRRVHRAGRARPGEQPMSAAVTAGDRIGFIGLGNMGVPMVQRLPRRRIPRARLRRERRAGPRPGRPGGLHAGRLVPGTGDRCSRRAFSWCRTRQVVEKILIDSGLLAAIREFAPTAWSST